MKWKLLFFGFLTLAVPMMQAQIIDLNTLHGFCGTSAATTTCFDNGVITPTGTNPLSPFGFTRSPDSNKNLATPTLTLEFLIPNDESVTMSAVDGTGTGNASVTPTLFAGTWTTGDLLAFLGLAQTGGPNNPIGAYLPVTQAAGGDPTATGYHVYQADFGAVTFGSPDPTFTDSITLPLGSVILGLVEGAAANSVQDSTANSSALLETVGGGGGGGGGGVPEPTSIVLLGSGLLFLSVSLRKKLARS